MISEMVNRQNSVVNSALKMNSLILDPTSYNVGDSKFMFNLYLFRKFYSPSPGEGGSIFEKN